MNVRRIGALIAAASFLVPLNANAAAPSLIGWAQGPAIAQELQYEHMMMRIPSPQRAMEIEHHISMVPHRAGTPADYATAKFVEARLKADGFQTRVVPYQVWFTGPTEQSLEIVSPKRVAFDLLGGTAPHTKWERMAGPAFLENSGDGDVTGPVYYVNGASKEDLQKLDEMHVNLRGAVVVVRLGAPGGGMLRGFDPSYNQYTALRQRGVAAILEFMDPATSGYGGGAMWPNGNYKNTHMAERMGGPSPAKSFFNGAPPGDPTYPGKAPVPGARHLAYSAIPHATIPEMSITQATARALLAGLAGQVVPQDWHPMFEFVQHVGGNERAHVHVKMTRHLTTIWNIIGDLRGSEEPNSIVMIGSHRDAMTFGAIDPGSGTTVMMQDADALHMLVQHGYRPKRTIEIASWDGHELGLWGSASYIYQYGPQLRKNVFQYINTDQLTTGNPFIISATTGLWAFIKQAADSVKGPDGLPLTAHNTKDEPLERPMTGGSDHQNFGYMLGIPSSSNGFYGAFGAHHTAEDNIDGLRTYDPGMKEAVATAQVTLLQAMRAAGATVDPLRMAEMSEQFSKDLPMVAAMALRGGTLKPASLAPLMAALKSFDAAAKNADTAMAAAETAGDTSAMARIAAQEQAARDAFYAPNGLAFNAYYHTLDRVFTSFPEIVFAGDDAKAQQAAIERFAAALQSATAALSGTHD